MKLLRVFSCLVGLLLSMTVLHAQDNQWSVNPYDYKYDMTVYARLTFDGTEVTDMSNYEIGAFVGNECRGVGEVQTKNSNTWIYLRVRSNAANGENISFKLYDKSEDRTYQLKPSQVVSFASQGIVGMPSTPIALDKPSYTLGDVNEDGIISVTDVVAVCMIIAQKADASFNEMAADANQDGKINITDIVTICQMMADKKQ